MQILVYGTVINLCACELIKPGFITSYSLKLCNIYLYLIKYQIIDAYWKWILESKNLHATLNHKNNREI